MTAPVQISLLGLGIGGLLEQGEWNFFHGTFLFLDSHFLHNVSPAYLIVQKCTHNIFRACIMQGICDGFQSFNHLYFFHFSSFRIWILLTPFQLIGLDKMESSQNIKFFGLYDYTNPAQYLRSNQTIIKHWNPLKLFFRNDYYLICTLHMLYF